MAVGRRYIALCAIVAGLVAASGAVADPAVAADQVDRILVIKSERKLYLLRAGEAVADYWIALGRHPVGAKERQGDGRTPEGLYAIDWRTEDTPFHRWLHISYPNATDRARADALGVATGGAIAIHGIPKDWGPTGPGRPMIDWTNGCIALTNHDLDQVWDRVANGTVIEIRP